MSFPRLFKKTNTGAIQFWDIEANNTRVDDTGDDQIAYLATIKTIYGQLDTDSPQVTYDHIKVGKNIGKKNETSAFDQAKAEAKSRWEKKKKTGYVEDITSAENDETDDLIQGGIVPMLAHTFEKQGHKIKYPCYVQPKLDGIRCIAIMKDGKCTLWSRTRKPITSCPHIVEEIENNFKNVDIVLDGELYNSEFSNNFEHIVHLVRQEEPDPQHTDVQYHIYDVVNDQTFDYRTLSLTKKFASSKTPNFKYLKLVDTYMVDEEGVIPNWFLEFTNQGYEGAMLRNSKGLYVNKRSADLIKVKEMKEEEFKIIGVEEGRGKLSGHVGAFVCKIGDQEFKAKMSGSTEKLKEYFENNSLWEGKKLTVQFQDFTSYGLPRFPVGKAIRDYE